jgi:uncharacterized membrane protein YfcA
MGPNSQSNSSTVTNFKPFLVWLAVFYCAWLAIVWFGGYFSTVVSHWPAALAMAVGSYFAGATPMGGGTVGFPVLVLLMDESVALGRNFAFAIQSIGMVSASLFLFCSRSQLEMKWLKNGCLGALVGTPLGAAFVAPYIPDTWVKLLFAVLCASFGLLHLAKLRDFVGARGPTKISFAADREIGLLVGFLGGIIASITGVGIDMLFYMLMVVVYRADLRIAIPTSVVLMAFTSLIGIASNLALGHFWGGPYAVSPELFYHWLAAAPIVAIGAPVGSFVVERISRKPTLLLVSVLCTVQFIAICAYERITGLPLVISIAAVLLVQVLFHKVFLQPKGERSLLPATESQRTS